jgi:hypothetical protein
MAKQLFLNNFSANFVAPVNALPSTATPATEVGYGVFRISPEAGSVLTNPSNGDFYVLTAYKKPGNVETNIEVIRVTAVDTSNPSWCAITVLRAQEGTAAQAYANGDYLSLRLTKGTADGFAQAEDVSNARRQDVRIVSEDADATLYATHVFTGVKSLKLLNNPVPGNWIRVINNSTGTPTVDRNGKPIMGLNENLQIDRANASLIFLFVDDVRGWIIS